MLIILYNLSEEKARKIIDALNEKEGKFLKHNPHFEMNLSNLLQTVEEIEYFKTYIPFCLLLHSLFVNLFKIIPLLFIKLELRFLI